MKRENNHGEGGHVCPSFLHRKHNRERTLWKKRKILKIAEMEKKYGMSFHKGAGTDVDICARDFVKRYSKKELGKVAKLHFKNTENI